RRGASTPSASFTPFIRINARTGRFGYAAIPNRRMLNQMEVLMPLDAFPRTPLCVLPTPLVRASRLEESLGPSAPRIWIKRDDLTGLALGGNKGRKLEFLVAGALADGATFLITEGAVQSNHARMTAAAANAAGLGCALVLDAGNGDAVAGNLLLDHLLGAEVHIVPKPEDRAAEMERVAADLQARGETPYLVPTCGSVPLGALGYVAAIGELMDQLRALGEAPVALYHATGSLGTQAGVVVGARAFAAPFEVRGIAVSHPAGEKPPRGAALANETARLMGLEATFSSDDVLVDGGYVGEAYGKRTPGCLEAIRLLAGTEGILLDPVYSGKAMAGLIDHIRAGRFRPNQSVVFLHTGGSPALFAHGEALLG
ncbi:MAG: D-cysteine desulfhydrase family protein, partial [Thermomicrobiales bacterium]